MIKIDSDKEFSLVRNSFSVLKEINLKDIGFNQISSSNLYLYQSNEYKILNYSIKPKVVFLINIEDDKIYLRLKDIKIKSLPNIFKTLKLNIEVNIFPEKNSYRIKRHISLKYQSENQIIKFVSKNLVNKFLDNLIEIISIRFDRKLIKKVAKAI